MNNLRFLILDEFDEKPIRAFSNKASALWFLENRPNCKLKILKKEKVTQVIDFYEECLF